MRNRVVAVAAFIMWATVVLAQAQAPPAAPFVLDVALDPTTYAPAQQLGFK